MKHLKKFILNETYVKYDQMISISDLIRQLYDERNFIFLTLEEDNFSSGKDFRYILEKIDDDISEINIYIINQFLKYETNYKIKWHESFYTNGGNDIKLDNLNKPRNFDIAEGFSENSLAIIHSLSNDLVNNIEDEKFNILNCNWKSNFITFLDDLLSKRPKFIEIISKYKKYITDEKFLEKWKHLEKSDEYGLFEKKLNMKLSNIHLYENFEENKSYTHLSKLLPSLTNKNFLYLDLVGRKSTDIKKNACIFKEINNDISQMVLLIINKYYEKTFNLEVNWDNSFYVLDGNVIYLKDIEDKNINDKGFKYIRSKDSSDTFSKFISNISNNTYHHFAEQISGFFMVHTKDPFNYNWDIDLSSFLASLVKEDIKVLEILKDNRKYLIDPKLWDEIKHIDKSDEYGLF